jgi:hypothetical protein
VQHGDRHGRVAAASAWPLAVAFGAEDEGGPRRRGGESEAHRVVGRRGGEVEPASQQRGGLVTRAARQAPAPCPYSPDAPPVERVGAAGVITASAPGPAADRRSPPRWCGRRCLRGSQCAGIPDQPRSRRESGRLHRARRPGRLADQLLVGTGHRHDRNVGPVGERSTSRQPLLLHEEGAGRWPAARRG